MLVKPKCTGQLTAMVAAPHIEGRCRVVKFAFLDKGFMFFHLSRETIISPRCPTLKDTFSLSTFRASLAAVISGCKILLFIAIDSGYATVAKAFVLSL